VTGSLAYRKHEAAILCGNAPEKYTRLLPYIPGRSVVEIGSAEGVLALLLVQTGKRVIAIEANKERHEAAKCLYMRWTALGLLPEKLDIQYTNGKAQDHLDLLAGIDTLICVRSIYYLGDRLEEVFSKAAANINTVVLCGNKNRAAMWRQGIPDKPGVANYYASAEGMRALLERHGYTITQEELEGDPIVVGRMG